MTEDPFNIEVEFTECPWCSSPATVEEAGTHESTHGPVRHVRVTCAAGCWFLGAADQLLPSPTQEGPTP